MQQVPVPKILDVQSVERQLAELWQETAGDAGDDAAVLRARVANLLIYVPSEPLLKEVEALMQDVTLAHPGRALLMLGEPDAADQDLEMFVSSVCQTDKRTGAKRLCGEVVVLTARGKFIVELPSAALPLLVSDLTTFFWWRTEFQLSDKVFSTLLQASDRLVIDSDEFANPLQDLLDIDKLFGQSSYKHVGVSDLNWARLTLWRGLLADFYDVPAHQPLLDEIDHVRVDYVAPALAPKTVAPQALLISGWLAGCLGWTLIGGPTTPANQETWSFTFSRKSGNKDPAIKEPSGGQPIRLELNRVEGGERTPGRLVEVELRTSGKRSASFSVRRSSDNLHILAETKMGSNIKRGRVLPVRNRSLAHLVSREMEILTNDNLYQQALAVATTLIDHSSSSNPSQP